MKKERKISPKFFDKELGWLLFNERVLELSETSSIPLLERLNFHNIFHSNLDEFFMKRVGRLRLRMKNMSEKDPIGSKVNRAYIQSLLEKVNEVSKRSFMNANEHIIPQLEKNGIILAKPSGLNAGDKKWLKAYFDGKVFPLLTPMVVDPGHPFPLISNLSYSLGLVVKRLSRNQRYFVRVKVPPAPLWIELPAQGKKRTYVHLLDVVEAYQDEILPRVEVESAFSFRVIRSLETDKKEYEEAEDLLELMAEEIRMRKYSDIVRFEYSGNLSPWAKQFLQRELEIDADDFAESFMPLPYKKIDAPAQLKIPKLRYRSFIPATPPALVKEDSVFKAIAKGDILLHHPFESFAASVEVFLREAADDPNVLSIKMTLYRAGSQSPIIEALSRAALNGKSVVCLVELKARLDEERNIQWAKQLEAAGVHVIYGVMDLKTHAKICVVVRKEGDIFKTYAHIGTGNYNGQTARLYTDLGLLTCNDNLAKELIKGFHYLTGMAGRSDFKKVLISPLNLKQRLLEMIEGERQLALAGKSAQIIIKVNSLDDIDVVKALYLASQAGVKIVMIVRGFSTLIPGLNGMSANIRVISILGRLLEHSRVYYFSNGKKNPLQGNFYIGSCDAMRRSFHERVELVVPVESAELRNDLWKYLEKFTNPNCSRWEMQPDGTYHRILNKSSYDIQQLLLEEMT